MWDPREDSYIQELAARIEALEEVADFEEANMLRRKINLIRQVVELGQQPDHLRQEVQHEPILKGTRYQSTATPADHPAPATEDSSATAPPAPVGVQRRYPSPATIAECGGPCESQGPEACDCGLLQELNPRSPAPAGGLVERVAKSLAEVNSSSAPEIWLSDARIAIRVVAAWLRSDGPGWPFVSSLLEREAEQ
jgi:hypothetical protein